MKNYTYEDVSSKIKSGEKSVPTKPNLWKKTNEIFDYRDTAAMVEYYENLGGRWKIITERTTTKTVENVTTISRPVVNLTNETYGFSEDDIKILERVSKYNPDLWKRIDNWD